MVRWGESAEAVAQECGGGQARIGEGLGRGLWVHGRPHTKWSTPLNRGGLVLLGGRHLLCPQWSWMQVPCHPDAGASPQLGGTLTDSPWHCVPTG